VERSTIVSRLRQTRERADLQVYTHELLEIGRSLKQLKDEGHSLSLTIGKAESLLWETDRRKRLRDDGIDSNDFNELAVLRVEIEERLQSSSVPRSAGEAIQIDEVIREARGSGSD
jgi:hypothetical protein